MALSTWPLVHFAPLCMLLRFLTSTLLDPANDIAPLPRTLRMAARLLCTWRAVPKRPGLPILQQSKMAQRLSQSRLWVPWALAAVTSLRQASPALKVHTLCDTRACMPGTQHHTQRRMLPHGQCKGQALTSVHGTSTRPTALHPCNGRASTPMRAATCCYLHPLYRRLTTFAARAQ